MKVAIYIEDGLVQLVCTPQGQFEKNALSTFTDKPLSVTIKGGSFYHCQGGWVRHGREDDKSLILCVEPERAD